MFLVLPPELAPLTLELHACSRPPPPTTAAPAPIARSRVRRLMPPPAGPLLPESTAWSLIFHRSPCEVCCSGGPYGGNRAGASPCTRERLVICRCSAATPFASGVPSSPLRQRPANAARPGPRLALAHAS